MAIWYMVKRMDTGEIYGHNTWEHTPVSSHSVNIGEVSEMDRYGFVSHLVVYVDGIDEEDARLMARVSFDMHEAGEDVA